MMDGPHAARVRPTRSPCWSLVESMAERQRARGECEKREEALPVIDIHGYLAGESTLASAAAEAAAAEARG